MRQLEQLGITLFGVQVRKALPLAFVLHLRHRG
jgi:hypothetical protein